MDVVPVFADVDLNGVAGFAIDAFETRSGISYARRAALRRPPTASVSLCGEPRCRAIKEFASGVGWMLDERVPRGQWRDLALDAGQPGCAGSGGTPRCAVAPGHEQLCELWKTFTVERRT
jgi:hypothetical protein